jgi:hypothetical protein
MIYLATPFSHPVESVRHERARIAAFVAGLLIKGGSKVYSPIAHSYMITQEHDDIGLDFESWAAIDREMIVHCSELWVVLIPGWDQSHGVREEFRFAQTLGKKLRAITPNLEDSPHALRFLWDRAIDDNRLADACNQIAGGGAE